MARMFHDWDLPTVNTQVVQKTTPDATADRDSRGALAQYPKLTPVTAQVLPADYRAGERGDVVQPVTTTEPKKEPVVEPVVEKPPPPGDPLAGFQEAPPEDVAKIFE